MAGHVEPALQNACQNGGEADFSVEISPEELAENWEALREIADACERESLDYMLENLEGYTLPEREARLLLELRTAAQEENWALIQKLVQ